MVPDIIIELIDHPTGGYRFDRVPHPLAEGGQAAPGVHAPNVGTLLTGRQLQQPDGSGFLRALVATDPLATAVRTVALEAGLEVVFQQLSDAGAAQAEASILGLAGRYGPLMPQQGPFRVLETPEFWLARAREMRELTARAQSGTLADDDYEAIAGLVGPVEPGAPAGTGSQAQRVRSLLGGIWLQWCRDGGSAYLGICPRCGAPKFEGSAREICSDLCRLERGPE